MISAWKKLIYRSLMFTLFGVFALIADGSTTSTFAEQTKVRVVTSVTGILHVLPYLAKEKGYFKEAGIDVEIFDGSGGSNAVAALVGGAAEVGNVGFKNAAQAVAKGQKLKAVSVSFKGFPISLVIRSDLAKKAGIKPDSPLEEKMQLIKGKVIAVTDVGGSTGGFIRYLLKRAGMKESDAKIINITNISGQLASLRAKKIDGFAHNSPVPETAVAGGFGYPLVVPVRDMPDLSIMTTIVDVMREDFIKENPDAVYGYLVGLRRALHLVQTDPAEAKKTFYSYMERVSSSSSVSQRTKDVTWDTNLPSVPKSLVLDEKGIAAIRNFQKVPESVTNEMFVDNSIAERVMSEPIKQ